MNAGTASSKAGVVAQVPHKEGGEWFVLVASLEEQPAVVRILSSLVSSQGRLKSVRHRSRSDLSRDIGS